MASACCVVPGTTSWHVPVCPCVFPVWEWALGCGRWLRLQSQALPVPTIMDLLSWVGSVGPFLLPEPLFHSQEQPGPSQLQFHCWEKHLKPHVGRVCTFRVLPGVGTFQISLSLSPAPACLSSRHLFVYCPLVRDVFALILFFNLFL